MTKAIAVIALIFILALVNYSIFQKEQHLAEGRIVYLQLAPVDPRSLMQGDYMALHFGVADQVYAKLPKATDDQPWSRKVNADDGYVVVELDEKAVGSFVRIDDGQPLADNEMKLRYRVRDGEVKFATNAFFFQEGHAQAYDAARYGQFRVDESGDVLLTDMFDANLLKIIPNQIDQQHDQQHDQQIAE